MKKHSLWLGYDRTYEQYETEYTPAFPWSHEGREDVPRYIKGEDGYWFDPSAQENKTALISCTGDIMCEPKQHASCKYGDTCFFHPEFRFVRNILKTSDFAVGNLETTVTDSTPYAGEYHVICKKYHCNAPESFLDALRYAGFDALVNANNHNMDSAVTGLADTLNALDRHCFMHTGTFFPADTERVLLVKVNGIKIAIASYSTKYNKLDANLTPLGKETFLNEYSKEKAERDVAYAREKGAQFFISYIHWGKEHVFDPIEDQVKWAQELADAGADYIVGSHSHCLQRYVKVTARDGREVPCIYSLGNFVTGAFPDINKHSAILQLLLKEVDGRIQVQEYFIPGFVFTQIETSAYAHVPLDGLLNGGITNETIENAWDYIGNIVQGLPYLPTGCVTLGELCRAMDVPCPHGKEKQPVTRLCTEKEAIVPGSVLFTDQEDFEQMWKNRMLREKVLAVICPSSIEGLDCITADAAAAYEKACKLLRSKYPGKVILVTGKKGKTEVKNMLCHILRSKTPVLTHADGPIIDCPVWQKFHPMHEYCVQELRPEHPYYDALARASQSILCVDTDENTEPEAGMAFPFDAHAAALARKAAKALGFTHEEITGALQTYKPENPFRYVTCVDGVTVVADLACKDAKPVLGAFEKQTGRKIAVIGELDLPADYAEITQNLTADIAVFCGEHGEELAKAHKGECLCPQTERELEKTLLSVLKPGDVLLLCSGRKLPMNITARKIFGITDNALPVVW